MKFSCLLLAAATAQTCSNKQNAVNAEIVAPMVARDGYVWFQGNELKQKANTNHLGASPKGDGGVTFDFEVKLPMNMCSQTQRATEAGIVAPMVARDGYVWFQGNELKQKANTNHLGASPKGDGGVTFDFEVKQAGKYTFQADLIAPNGNDDSFYVTTSVDNGTPKTWHTGRSSSWRMRDIGSLKGQYFPEGTHSITLKPREDGTKVRAIRVNSKNVCFQSKPLAAKPTFEAELIAPNGNDDSFYVTTSVDNGTPKTWHTGRSYDWKWKTMQTGEFAEGSHSITLKPREDGTKVRAIRATKGSESVCFKAPEPVDVEMEINETVESFTAAKKQALINKIAKQLGLAPEDVEITVGAKANPVGERRLIEAEGLLITVTVNVMASKVGQAVEELDSKEFAKATGAQFLQFKPAHGSKICATCKWDGHHIQVTHYVNAQKHGEKGLQHKCYHIGAKCTCKCK